MIYSKSVYYFYDSTISCETFSCKNCVVRFSTSPGSLSLPLRSEVRRPMGLDFGLDLNHGLDYFHERFSRHQTYVQSKEKFIVLSL